MLKHSFEPINPAPSNTFVFERQTPSDQFARAAALPRLVAVHETLIDWPLPALTVAGAKGL